MIKDKFSRVGFILAATGSAVGLGNIWKFPYITGDNGGGVFVLVYLFTILFIGISVFIAESYIGFATHKNSVDGFTTLASKNKKFWGMGGFSFLTALLILSFYVVVIGWILKYIVVSLTALPSSVEEAQTLFLGMLQEDMISQIAYYAFSFFLVAFIVSKGIKKGIEKVNTILMPTLIVLLFGMLLYSMSFDSFGKAVSFMFYPDFENFKSDSILVAVGHAFFTLSIGMAVILTYSSSISRDTNIVKSSVIVAFLDTVIALIAGLVIFTILFNANMESSQGAGLVFITLPALFYQFGIVGNILSLAFFISLAFAGITSAISILEPAVRYVEEKKDVSRVKATYFLALFISLIGLVALLSNLTIFSESLTFGSKNLFDWFDYISSAILLPLGGIITAIFVGFFIDQNTLKNNMLHFMSQKVFSIWLFSIRFIVPIGVGAVMLEKMGLFS